MKKQFNDIRNDFAIAMAKMNAKNVINELDFKDAEEMSDYEAKHEIGDNTEVTVGGVTTKREDVGKNLNIKKKLSKNIEKIQGEYKRIAFENEEDAKAFPGVFDKLLGGEKLSEDDAKMVAKYAKIATTDKGETLKIYFASNSPGNFLQGGREKAIEMADKDGSLQKDMMDNGMGHQEVS